MVVCSRSTLPGGNPEGGEPSPSEMLGMYAKFNEWREKFQKNLTDMGG
jgi:hypothetical protein